MGVVLVMLIVGVGVLVMISPLWWGPVYGRFARPVVAPKGCVWEIEHRDRDQSFESIVVRLRSVETGRVLAGSGALYMSIYKSTPALKAEIVSEQKRILKHIAKRPIDAQSIERWVAKR